MHQIAYSPQPGPQTEFHRRREDIIGYGGTKGPGKTHGLIGEATRQINNPRYKAIILRRTYPQLQEIIDRCRIIYGQMGATWNGDEKRFKFPSGAWIGFGHCQYEHDVENYQGKEYDFIGIDQAEQWTKYMVDYMLAQNRGTAPNIRRYAALTFNPGGIGHHWIKELFIKDASGPKTPGQTYYQTFTLPDGRKISRSYVFIKGTVFDNKILMDTQPQYLATLYALPEKMRRAYLDGDFDIFEGQFFDTWRESVHVVKPFSIGPEYRIYMSMDWGYSAPLSIHWWAVSPEGKRVYCVREYYLSGKNSQEVAREVHAINIAVYGKNYISARRVQCCFYDPSIDNDVDGKSIAESFRKTWVEMREDGKVVNLPMVPANNDRINGWDVFRRMLEVGEDGKPRCQWFDTCVNAIRTIPGLQHDDIRPEDLDTDGEDHAADDHRYFFISRFGANKIEPQDPLEDLKEPGSKQEWKAVYKRILNKKTSRENLTSVGR